MAVLRVRHDTPRLRAEKTIITQTGMFCCTPLARWRIKLYWMRQTVLHWHIDTTCAHSRVQTQTAGAPSHATPSTDDQTQQQHINPGLRFNSDTTHTCLRAVAAAICYISLTIAALMCSDTLEQKRPVAATKTPRVAKLSVKQRCSYLSKLIAQQSALCLNSQPCEMYCKVRKC